MSRTSARTSLSRCPVARSMSSALASSSRATAEPTVPYPRRATGTSTDTRLSGRLLARHQRPELETDLLDLPLARSGPQLVEGVLARVHLRDPLPRERPVLDLAEHLPHLGANVLVDDAVAAREISVLGRVGD